MGNGGTIDVGTTSAATLLLDDGTTITDGRLTIGGNNTLDIESVGGATLDGVTVTGATGPTASLIEVGANTTSGSILTLDDGTSITDGRLTIGGNSTLDIESVGGATLDGVTVTGATGPTASLIEVGANTTSGSILTLGDGTSITDGNLTIGSNSTLDIESAGGATLDGVTVTGATGPTASSIEVGANTTSGSILTLDDGTSITDGRLTIGGNSTLDIESVGGATLDGVTVTGTTGPTASLIEVGTNTTSGSIVTLDDGTSITNGNLAIAGGSTLGVESSAGATLDNVTVTGTGTIQVDVPTELAPATLNLDGGTSITGGNLSIGSVGTVVIQQGTGGSTVTLDDVAVTGTDAVLTVSGAIVTPASLIDVGTTSVATLLLDDGTQITNGNLTIGSGSTLHIATGANATGVHPMQY